MLVVKRFCQLLIYVLRKGLFRFYHACSEKPSSTFIILVPKIFVCFYYACHEKVLSVFIYHALKRLWPHLLWVLWKCFVWFYNVCYEKGSVGIYYAYIEKVLFTFIYHALKRVLTFLCCNFFFFVSVCCFQKYTQKLMAYIENFCVCLKILLFFIIF